jgi:hypothetical protein
MNPIWAWVPCHSWRCITGRCRAPSWWPKQPTRISTSWSGIEFYTVPSFIDRMNPSFLSTQMAPGVKTEKKMLEEVVLLSIVWRHLPQQFRQKPHLGVLSFLWTFTKWALLNVNSSPAAPLEKPDLRPVTVLRHGPNWWDACLEAGIWHHKSRRVAENTIGIGGQHPTRDRTASCFTF